MKNKTQERGITLIALVITIIVLLILAAVSIATLTGENGILTKVSDSKEQTEYGQALEEVRLALSATSIGYQANNKKFAITDECASNVQTELGKMSENGTVYVDGEFMYAENRGYIFEISGNMEVKKYDIEIVNGDTALWVQENGVLIEYKGDVSQLDGKKLVIPNYVDGVRIKEIGQNLFAGKIIQPLEVGLNISKGIKVIGQTAFAGCSGITGELTIPNSVTTIGSAAFTQTKLTGSLIIPDSVTFIGGGAFSSCTGFTGNLTIKKASCEGGAFSGCTGFNGKFIIGTTNINEGFYSNLGGTNFIGLELLNGVETIGNGAFYNCANFKESLNIPDSVTSIGIGAFKNCTGFTGDLIIGNNVKTIGDEAFYGCSGFTGKLTIGLKDIPSYFMGNYLYGANFTELEITEGTINIGNNAFSGCSGFTGNLIIPNTVTEIGVGAFSDCSGFTGNLTIPNSVTTLEVGTFYNCTGFNGKLSLGMSNIFDQFASKCIGGTNFTELVLEEGVNSVGKSAFAGYTSLDVVRIPSTLETMGDYAFRIEKTGETKLIYVDRDPYEVDNWSDDWVYYTWDKRRDNSHVGYSYWNNNGNIGGKHYWYAVYYSPNDSSSSLDWVKQDWESQNPTVGVIWTKSDMNRKWFQPFYADGRFFK